MREELCKLGARPSKLDQGVFYFRSAKEIVGIIVLFVDDLLWAGKPTFIQTINQLKMIFHIGSENASVFKYVGINIEQKEDKSIQIHQSSYAESINTIPLCKEQSTNPHRQLNENEKHELRSALGQLNWLSNISRPEISFQVSFLSSNISGATINDIKHINKVIKYVKDNKQCIYFPSLDVPTTKVVMYSDASFNNLRNGSSQGAYLVFLVDKYNNSCPIAWKSNKLRRVARSTLAAETLAFADGCDAAHFISQFALESCLITSSPVVTSYTDNKSLYESANTTTQVSDKRLRVELSAIREAQDNNEIYIKWVAKEEQLADSLTKRGASSQQLSSVLQRGNLN